MPIRFRKRIKLLPGVYINLSRSGISTSVGVRGASITSGHGKTRTNVGIPGSGISYNKSEANEVVHPAKQSTQGMSMLRLLAYGIAGLFLTILILGLFHRI